MFRALVVALTKSKTEESCCLAEVNSHGSWWCPCDWHMAVPLFLAWLWSFCLSNVSDVCMVFFPVEPCGGILSGFDELCGVHSRLDLFFLLFLLSEGAIAHGSHSFYAWLRFICFLAVWAWAYFLLSAYATFLCMNAVEIPNEPDFAVEIWRLWIGWRKLVVNYGVVNLNTQWMKVFKQVVEIELFNLLPLLFRNT